MATAGRIESIYISAKSAAPIESLEKATLVAGVGIEGDRNALQTGTYSAKFLNEPGRQVTIVSADGIEATMSETGMTPFESLGELRRNLVVRGITAEAVNAMVGHEVRVGNNDTRLFIHRRTVPCKYRELHTKRPGLMNNLWDVCGVNCEILTGGTIGVGDSIAVIPNTYQPQRVNPGSKPPAFFIKPSDRTAEHHKSMMVPPIVAAIMCLIDPVGFQRVEDGYNSVGTQFWSSKAYRAGMTAKNLRAPLIIASVAIVMAIITVASARKFW